MSNPTKSKKLLAKEVLIFFSGILLLAIFLGVLLLRNYYYKNKVEHALTQFSYLTIKINELPVDKIKNIYDNIHNDFVVSYQANKESFKIIKRQENKFLNDHPYAIKLPIHEKGYFYSYIKQESIDREEFLVEESEISQDDKKLYEKRKRRINRFDDLFGKVVDYRIFFDFVKLDAFKTFISDSTYRENIFSSFNEDKLGTRSAFEANIIQGLEQKYELKNDTLRSNYKKEYSKLETASYNFKANILSPDKIFHIVLVTAFFIGIALFPLRYVFNVIKWAIKTTQS